MKKSLEGLAKIINKAPTPPPADFLVSNPSKVGEGAFKLGGGMLLTLEPWIITRVLSEPVRRFKAGRHCKYCGKELSVYNSDSHCCACNLEHKERAIEKQEITAHREYYLRRKARQS